VGLAARWVCWAAGVESSRNPIGDLTGEYAGLNQPDDVWFLAGTFGGRAERRCAVPYGRRIFVPAFNIWEYPASGPPEYVQDGFGSIEVDGAEVPVQPIETPVPFDVAGVRGNPVTSTTRPIPVVVSGLWGLIDPLAPGGHTLELRGGFGRTFEVCVTYHLTVA
jgi:hypothetical protein